MKKSFVSYLGLVVLMLAWLWSVPVTCAQKDLSPRTGTIAYVRGSTEIRLINADGTNDRRLWTHPDAKKELGIYDEPTPTSLTNYFSTYVGYPMARVFYSQTRL